MAAARPTAAAKGDYERVLVFTGVCCAYALLGVAGP